MTKQEVSSKLEAIANELGQSPQERAMSAAILATALLVELPREAVTAVALKTIGVVALAMEEA
jgi:HD-like signal output (HDOD) protein